MISDRKKEVIKIIDLYKKGFSMMEIAKEKKCSIHKIVYWLDKYKFPRRSYSESTYIKRNPEGDPFKIKIKLNKEEFGLKCMGLGLYWGEGNKKNNFSVKLGNSDPELIKTFRSFLIKICNTKEEKIKYGLLLFNDANKNKAINFWNKKLGYNRSRISYVTTLKPRGKGTYKNKSQTGVLMMEFCNTKLKKKIDLMLNEYIAGIA